MTAGRDASAHGTRAYEARALTRFPSALAFAATRQHTQAQDDTIDCDVAASTGPFVIQVGLFCFAGLLPESQRTLLMLGLDLISLQ